jgi:hypothetical protein
MAFAQLSKSPAPQPVGVSAPRRTPSSGPQTVCSAASNELAGPRFALPPLHGSEPRVRRSLQSPTAPVIQAKLEIGDPNDRFEQEADRVADQVMRMPDNTGAPIYSAPRSLQRMCRGCAEEDGKIRRQAASSLSVPRASTVPRLPANGWVGPGSAKEPRSADGVGIKLHSSQSLVEPPEPRPLSRLIGDTLQAPGRPLDVSTRAFMEPRFGYSFGQVRVHTDARAADSARAVSARAYTLGNDIVFAESQYKPNTEQGRRLLAHELVHTVQQGAIRAKAQPSGLPHNNVHVAGASTLKTTRCYQPSHRPELNVRATIQRQPANPPAAGDRKVFLEQGFTGRETPEEARLIAASKGWVVEGELRWNGKNWIGEKVRRGTGAEKAIAQVKLDLAGLGEFAGGELLSEGSLDRGFDEGQSFYSEEQTYEPRFGRTESEQAGGTGNEISSGVKAESGAEGKQVPDAKEGTESGKGGNELDPLTALASLVLDPESLAESAQKGKTGETGAPVGSKSGFITGPLAKVLTVLAAVASFLTGPLLKLLGKLKKSLQRMLDSIRNRIRKLRGVRANKALPGKISIAQDSPRIAIITKENEVVAHHSAASMSHDQLIQQTFKGAGLPEGARAVTIGKEDGAIYVLNSFNIHGNSLPAPANCWDAALKIFE